MAGGAGRASLAIRKLARSAASVSASSSNTIRRVGIESGIQAEECSVHVHRAFATKATRGKSKGSAPTTTPQVKAEPTVKKRLYKGRNLIEVAQFLPGWGVGAKMSKAHWRSNTFYQITDIKLNKDGRHGAAWGVFHEEGIAAEKPQKIGGVNKRQWKYLKELPETVWKTLPEVKRTEVKKSSEAKGKN